MILGYLWSSSHPAIWVDRFEPCWARSIWDSIDGTDGVVKNPSKENDKAHGFGRFEHVDGDVGETQRTWKTLHRGTFTSVVQLIR